MKYLTKAGKESLEMQLQKAHYHLRHTLNKPVDSCEYRQQKRYIDGLNFLLDMELFYECIKVKKNDK